MTRLAAWLVRLWVRLSTAGLESATRTRIRQEVEADLWEQTHHSDSSGDSALAMVLRWLQGVPADTLRMSEELAPRVYAQAARLVTLATQRKTRVVVLAAAFLLASVFTGFVALGAFIVAVLVISARFRVRTDPGSVG